MGRVTKGNVFEDLGFSREEAADLAMKAKLASDLRKFIERQELTQVKAAAFFSVPRPKISKIQNSDLTGITIDYLVRMLAKTGGRLTCEFRQPAKKAVEARLRDLKVA